MTDRSLRLTEIFFSLQGESSYVGLPTVFVRLTGCPLRCVYCDTEYAFEGGKRWNFQDIFAEIESYPTDRICVTGGEPLAQPLCQELLTALADKGYQISLETSGAISVADVDSRICKVLDLKTPGSGESKRNLWENIEYLGPGDQVKFVIADQQDFDWAVSKVIEKGLEGRVSDVLFSAVHNQYPLPEMAEGILRSGLSIRMQVQLHKFIWGDAQGK